MSEDDGRHTAPPAPQSERPRDAEFVRPAGVEGGFAPRTEPPSYRPPPPTVSPEERAVFGRPAGAEPFAPAPGERLAPRHADRPMVPPAYAAAFAPPTGARDSFAPSPGDRLEPSHPGPESPWWKSDADRDPWRDPQSNFWLGRGAIFMRGRPAQLGPDEDTPYDEEPEPPEATEDESAEPAPKIRRVRFGMSSVVLLVLFALLAGALGGGIGWWMTDHVDNALHRPDVSIAKVKTPAKRDPTSAAGVAKRVGPAVVSIAVTTDDGSLGLGSGVVIHKDGYVLTNDHVIARAANGKGTIAVTFSNEATAKAQIVGRDPTSDLAVIKVPNDQLTVAQLGDSDEVAVGDSVIAIGSPLGLQGTVTQGIVSALNRPVHSTEVDGSNGAYLDAIQTDAAINPGNSGGALVNASGAVIGINAAGSSSVTEGGVTVPVSGIGYAIPINYARAIALQLIHTGKAQHASLGAQGVTALAGDQVGAYLKQVSPGGAAAKAGLRPGDVIVAADGQVVQSFDQLIVIVQQHKPGERIGVTYYPKNSAQKRTKTVTLG